MNRTREKPPGNILGRLRPFPKILYSWAVAVLLGVLVLSSAHAQSVIDLGVLPPGGSTEPVMLVVDNESPASFGNVKLMGLPPGLNYYYSVLSPSPQPAGGSWTVRLYLEASRNVEPGRYDLDLEIWAQERYWVQSKAVVEAKTAHGLTIRTNDLIMGSKNDR
jgi:hypothetical protein